MVTGRPKKTLKDLPKNWKQGMIDIATEGGSDVRARVFLKVSNDLWYRLKDEEPQFSETIKQCKQLCETWWETKGMEMMSEGTGNATIWIFNMKNRFGWRDKSEITGKDGAPVFEAKIIYE